MKSPHHVPARGSTARALIRSAVLALGLGAANIALADVEVTLDELPPAVRKTALAEVKNGVIEEIEREEEHGQIVYEVEFILDNIKYELDIAEDGTLLRRHRD